jgi:hypothetical protein
MRNAPRRRDRRPRPILGARERKGRAFVLCHPASYSALRGRMPRHWTHFTGNAYRFGGKEAPQRLEQEHGGDWYIGTEAKAVAHRCRS